MGNTTTHTADEIWAEKVRWTNMTKDQKMKFYVGYVPQRLEDIPTWGQYYGRIPILERVPEDRRRFEPDSSLNSKVSIWKGDITRLEIGGIVNSAANPDKPGQVNKAIMEQAGEFFKDECILQGLVNRKPGDVIVTGGYRMPCQTVINTLAPPTQDDEALLRCYSNSLDAARDHNITSIAFPCIATRKKNAFPKVRAARLVLTTVREWLKNNSISIERVVFCVYTDEDFKVYEEMLQEFFPAPLRQHRERLSMAPTVVAHNSEASGYSQDGFEDEEPNPKPKSRKSIFSRSAKTKTLYPPGQD